MFFFAAFAVAVRRLDTAAAAAVFIFAKGWMAQ
jgi:hypothetical protein